MSDKKLVWFNGRLLKPYVGYWSRHQNKYVDPKPYDLRLEWHVAMFKLHPGIICMIDHTGFSRNYGDGLDMDIVVNKSPDIYKTSWDLERGKLMDQDFAGMINSRADAAYAQADRYGYEYIMLSYGGGVDSCTLLAAMLQNPAAERWINDRRLIIRTTGFAQREDPLVWKRLVELDLPLEYHNYDDLMRDQRNWMLVTGDVEPVWGSAFTTLPQGYVPDDELFSGDYNQLESWFLEKEPSGLAWDYFRDIQRTAPFEVKTNFQAWWWFEWCTNTQCYMFRPAAYSDCIEIAPGMVYPGSKMFWVLANTDMWDHGAYVTANRLIPENLSQLKIHSLRYLADWMGWSEPRPKPKIFSQMIIPKRISKLRIWNDLSWDKKEDICDDWC